MIARIFALLIALAIGVALVSLAADQLAWAAGAVIAASVAAIAWGLAKAIEEPDPEPVDVMWCIAPPFGVERVITPAPVTTELTYKPVQGHTVIRGGRQPAWASRHPDHRPVWDTDIHGAPE